jgi:hypothetical protein
VVVLQQPHPIYHAAASLKLFLLFFSLFTFIGADGCCCFATREMYLS